MKLSQEPLHQYLACLYSFECIFHADSKYGYKNWKFLKKLEKFELFCVLSMHWEIESKLFFFPDLTYI